MKEDIELYNDFLQGNQEAFDKLMNKHRRNLIYFIQRYVKDIDTAEDLAQDVFVYILLHKKEYDFKYSLKTYLYTIAKSRALNYLKKQSKIVPVSDDIDYIKNIDDINKIEEEIFNNEKKKKLYNAIDKLNRNQQEVVYLIDIDEMSYKETCKILGKTLPQVKMTIHRARNKLKNILLKEEDS